MANLLDYIPLDPGREFLQGMITRENIDSQRLRNDITRRSFEFDENKRNTEALGVLGQMLEGISPDQRQGVYQSGIKFLDGRGFDVSDMPEVLDEGTFNQLLYAKNASLGLQGKRPSSVREYEYFNKLSPEEQAKYLNVKRQGFSLGDQRFDPSGNVIVGADIVGESKRKVAASEEAGKSAIKKSDAAMETLGKVNTQIANIDDAIDAIDKGAQSGAIASKFPSIKSSSIQLDNARKRLGLDIIGVTTFGALSKGELDLALSTAVPTDLQPQALKAWLQERKRVQTQLAKELEQAAIYLGTPGNTPAGYLEMRRNQEKNRVKSNLNIEDLINKYAD